eukprot:scaffold6803_cov60-Cylindrotheca_fusiformis.AAC.8
MFVELKKWTVENDNLPVAWYIFYVPRYGLTFRTWQGERQNYFFFSNPWMVEVVIEMTTPSRAWSHSGQSKKTSHSSYYIRKC